MMRAIASGFAQSRPFSPMCAVIGVSTKPGLTTTARAPFGCKSMSNTLDENA